MNPGTSKFTVSILAFGLAIWLLAIFAISTYSVGAGETAVVLRGGDPVREASEGRHLKIPFLEETHIYPTGELHRLESQPHKYLLKSGAIGAIGFTTSWRVCNASAMAKKWAAGYHEEFSEALVYQAISDVIRTTASEISSTQHLSVDFERSIQAERAANERLSEEGICVSTLSFAANHSLQGRRP